MVGKEDASGDPLASAAGVAPCQPSSSVGGCGTAQRKMFWRSASWSSSRTGLQNPESEEKNCGLEPQGNDGCGGNNGQRSRYPAPTPLTPRSQQSKARSCLPPLQPLAIARRSFDEWPKAGSDDLGEWPQPTTPSGNRCGERLKLDLSSIQRNPEKNGGKRDKIAFFDKECSKVAEHVYLGGDAVAKDRDILKQNGITHVLNCVGFVCPEYFKADFVYRTLWLQDSPSEDITSILYDVFDYFEDVREQGGRVFVHCCQGVSRSTSLVIAYLMWREGQSFDDAFLYVKAARGIADPNMGFACQLLQCQKRVHAFPLSPSSLLRMYRIAPHSSYDPLHLVPRMLNDPSPSALDSRGAFIVHIPSAIYIWVGKYCEAIMERDARGSVCQIMRYERAHAPIILIKEGDEPAYFWDAFWNYLPLMEKSQSVVDTRNSVVKVCPGERKVKAYDTDYEIFKKASKGGFVPPFTSSESEHETHLPARESSWSVLRRKFAPGDMKEFVSAPKIFLSRVYSDSMMIVHSSSPSSSSSLSSSSTSSPSYLSPDSISSESSSSSKYLSESSLDSPSASPCSLLASSALSNFSNLSLDSSKASPQPPNTSGFNDISLHQLRSSPVASLTSKKSSPSIAERRGSLSKCLKLPSATVTPQTSVVTQSNGPRIKNATFSWYESDTSDIILESKNSVTVRDGDSSKQCNSNPSLNRLADTDSLTKEVVFTDSSDEFWGNTHLGEGLGSVVPCDIESDFSACFKMQPVACQWPSLERLSTFSARDLDSKFSYAIVVPVKCLGKENSVILYLWIGRSFSSYESTSQLDSSRGVAGPENINWNQVGSHVLTQMKLPKDIPVKVIKEDEEPAEFRSLLKS